MEKPHSLRVDHVVGAILAIYLAQQYEAFFMDIKRAYLRGEIPEATNPRTNAIINAFIRATRDRYICVLREMKPTNFVIGCNQKGWQRDLLVKMQNISDVSCVTMGSIIQTRRGSELFQEYFGDIQDGKNQNDG